MTTDIPHCFLRADASERIGLGHVMRSLALAQAWRAQGGKATLVGCVEQAPVRSQIAAAGVGLIPLDAMEAEAGGLNATIRGIEDHSSQIADGCDSPWLVLDGPHLGADYVTAARARGACVAVLDDHGRLPFLASSHPVTLSSPRYDLVVNSNLGAVQLADSCPPETALLLGPRYALVRQAVLAWRKAPRSIPEAARNVLVTCGGSDPFQVTERVIVALRQLAGHAFEVRIVVGPANPRLPELRSQAPALGPEVRIVAEPFRLPELMAWADLAVSTVGVTCWEMALLGLPNLTISLTAEQDQAARLAERRGVLVNLGTAAAVTCDTIASGILGLAHEPRQRALLRNAGRNLVDGRGAARVVARMRGSTMRTHEPHARLTGQSGARPIACRSSFSWLSSRTLSLENFRCRPAKPCPPIAT